MEPLPDVTLGRGCNHNAEEHKAYIGLIRKNCSFYKNAGSKADKDRIAREIRQNFGRFFKKGREMSEPDIDKSIKQAIRDEASSAEKKKRRCYLRHGTPPPVPTGTAERHRAPRPRRFSPEVARNAPRLDTALNTEDESPPQYYPNTVRCFAAQEIFFKLRHFINKVSTSDDDDDESHSSDDQTITPASWPPR